MEIKTECPHCLNCLTLDEIEEQECWSCGWNDSDKSSGEVKPEEPVKPTPAENVTSDPLDDADVYFEPPCCEY